MSLPARKIARPAPSRAPGRGPSPKRTPRTTSPQPDPRRRPARRPSSPQAPWLRRHLGFMMLAAAVIAVSVAGLVTLNAFLAQSSFRIDDLQGRVGGLAERYQRLSRETAHLSAPGRIAAWAERHGMRLPDAGDLHVLHVPGAGPAAPAGEADPLDRSREALKPIVVGGG